MITREVDYANLEQWAERASRRIGRKRGDDGCFIPNPDDTEERRSLNPPSQRARNRLPVKNPPAMLLKACPKCGGTLTREHDDYGYGDYACIQCGAAWDIKGRDRKTKRILLDRPGYHITPDQQVAESGRLRRGGPHEVYTHKRVRPRPRAA